jgi:hypothetical protein
MVPVLVEALTAVPVLAAGMVPVLVEALTVVPVLAAGMVPVLVEALNVVSDPVEGLNAVPALAAGMVPALVEALNVVSVPAASTHPESGLVLVQPVLRPKGLPVRALGVPETPPRLGEFSGVRPGHSVVRVDPGGSGPGLRSQELRDCLQASTEMLPVRLLGRWKERLRVFSPKRLCRRRRYETDALSPQAVGPTDQSLGNRETG